MGRSPCCQNMGLKKGPWTPEEDQKLTAYVQEHGNGNWRWLPAKADLQRCGKSCRLRWINYLRPDIKRGNFSLEEDRTIIQLHALLGNKWSIIAAHLPGRTDNEIKNYWNCHLKKRLIKLGIDPITHQPKTEALGQSQDAAYLRHMAQWESARLEAETRLLRESKLLVQNQSSSSQPSRLIITKIPPQPSFPPCLDILKAWQSSWPSSSESVDSVLPIEDHNRRLHYTYAIMLANDDGFDSPASTWSFSETTKLPISNNGINMIETSCGPKHIQNAERSVESSTMFSLKDDDDIMVAAEAFRAGKRDNIAVLSNSNSATEGLNDEMSAFEYCCEKFAEEIGDGSKLHYWNSLMKLDNDSPTGSPVFLSKFEIEIMILT